MVPERRRGTQGPREEASLPLSFQPSYPACFPSAPLGTALDLRSKTSREVACAGVELPTLQPRLLLDCARRPRGGGPRYRESRAKRSVREMSFRASRPACFPSAPLGTALDLRSKTSREETSPTMIFARRPRGKCVAAPGVASMFSCRGQWNRSANHFSIPSRIGEAAVADEGCVGEGSQEGDNILRFALAKYACGAQCRVVR